MSISAEFAANGNALAARRRRVAAPDQLVRHYVIKNVPTAYLTESAIDRRDELCRHSYDDASHVFVLDEQGRMAGTVAIGKVMTATPDITFSELVRPPDGFVVGLEADREEAASIAIRSGLSTLAVCDRDGGFVGAVPASALMSILRDEHMEDLHHMAGILSRSAAAQEALTAPPVRRALYRLPWLLVGLAGSAVATALMARFEALLNAKIAVAFFVPAVVYLADAIGTQSEAVAVRGLSLTKARLITLLAGELATGLLIGTALAATAFPLIWLTFGDAALATTVAVSVVAASSIATTIGLLLPWMFARIGCDPALGAGPVATVIQDVLSLAIYFFIAAALIIQ